MSLSGIIQYTSGGGLENGGEHLRIAIDPMVASVSIGSCTNPSDVITTIKIKRIILMIIYC